jgi:hypothetical protein
MMDMKATLTKGVKEVSKFVAPDKTMKELISKVFSTRNGLHFAHWKSHSYAEHVALGELYEGIVGVLDEVVEVYQGKYGLLNNVSCGSSTVPGNVVSHIKAEAAWVGSNRDTISNNCEAIGAILDTLEAAYLKVIYKLENLK